MLDSLLQSHKMNAVDQHQYSCRNENPSFSSTLLEVIYRSIDERDSVRRNGGSKNINEVAVRRKSATGFVSSSRRSEGKSLYFNSNVGSSCYSYPAGYSSSETIYGFPARPRPIRTSIHEDNECKHQLDDWQPNAQLEGSSVKTKSRAMKIYGYLKKGKQPISPGGRLATFLISLFSTGNAKKSKISSPCSGGHDEVIIHANRKSKSANASTSSSATSFSRSCLSNTPSSSRGKLTTAGMKRSARFYPASVIVDECAPPRANSSLQGDRSDWPAMKFGRNSINEEKNRHFEETTRNLLKNYQKKVEYAFNSIRGNATNDDDDDDDGASYASSDLFELDHLSAIGIDGCMQELPLYETTSIDVNRAIANGLLV